MQFNAITRLNLEWLIGNEDKLKVSNSKSSRNFLTLEWKFQSKKINMEKLSYRKKNPDKIQLTVRATQESLIQMLQPLRRAIGQKIPFKESFKYICHLWPSDAEYRCKSRKDIQITLLQCETELSK